MRTIIFVSLIALASCYPLGNNAGDFSLTGTVVLQNSWRILNEDDMKELVSNKLPKSLEHIGKSSDGKAFFADSTEMSWHDARQLCESFNLKQIAITSQSQQDFFTSTAAIGRYWTSAREHRWTEGFTWDKLPGVINMPKYQSNWYMTNESNFPYRLCADLVRSTDAYNGIMGGVQCTDKRRVLCEA